LVSESSHSAKLGTPTKRLVSKRQVSKRLVSKRPVFKFDKLIKQKVFVFVIFTYY
jgi:hypothetical protein